MSDRLRPKSSTSPDDETLDAHVAGHRGDAHCRVELVEGSSPELSSQTQSLLHVRLRSAAIVLFSGSLLFLLKRLFYDSMQGATDPTLVFGDHFLFAFHVVNVVGLGSIAALLCRKRKWCMLSLRGFELGIFGLSTLFFATVQHYSTLFTAEQYGYADDPIGVWCLLILVYGMFIPNTWRRAACVIAVIACTPLVTLAYDAYQLGGTLITLDRFTSRALMMLVEFGATVFGTHMIGRLRREAYEARQLGQYRLRHRIGAGGMGEVYLAEHQLLKRPCAIKLIRAGKAADPRALARFEREVRVTATLSHWNTIEIFDYGSTDDGTFYYVMEYLPGLSILDLVERYGPLPAERVIHLLEQTCDALREAHAVGLIHRDVKPGNVFAAQRGGVYDVAKLLDFGLVKPVAMPDALELTQDGLITGSPLYMSPEQASGDGEPDARSDIYAIGAVAYFMLTGRPPFWGEKALRVLLAHMNDPVVPPSQLRPEVPADLEQVVMRCLAKDPADRYPDAGTLAQAFADCQAAGLWTRERAERWWRESHHEPIAPEVGCPAEV
jgi:eukaryotic-like serine/threonine-protein kinase